MAEQNKIFPEGDLRQNRMYIENFDDFKAELLEALGLTDVDENGLSAIVAILTAIKGSGWSNETLKAIKDLITSGQNTQALEATLTAMKGAGWSTETLKAIADKITIAIDGGNLTHAITVAHGTDEQLLFEVAKTGTYALSCFLDLDTLVTAAEGTVVTLRLYNKIDGSNYSDKPIAKSEFVIASGDVYPNFEAMMLFGYSKVTIQVSSAVSTTRTISYRKIIKDLS